jgi:hypothetical protein
MTITANDLPAILESHRSWLQNEGGSKANLSGANLYKADLSGAYLSGADLSGAKNVMSFGPVGEERRIGYAVRHDGIAMVKLGCFWGTQKDALAAISKKYGPRSKYAALVRAACACLLEEN